MNLGTPASPKTADVRTYLREFLMDRRVIDVPAIQRWLIVHLFILPFRPRQSGKAYDKVWTDRGSPLLFHGRDLQRKVQERAGDSVLVDLAMRYGEPSVPQAFDRFAAAGIRRVVVFPLFPQFSSAANGSAQQHVMQTAGKRWNVPDLQFVPVFYDHPAYIDACAEAARSTIESGAPEKVYFSFHGLPERQILKSDDSGIHCLQSDQCCDAISDANRNCYRAQCFATARQIAEKLGVPEKKRVICFQSRLGRTPWIRPFTDELLAQDARAGVKRAVILSPAFVADCLETTEELGIRGVESWTENGGESLTVAPCVNSSDSWADAVLEIAREQSSWIP